MAAATPAGTVFGTVILFVLVLPPFIAGLRGVASRLPFNYALIVAVCFALLNAWSFIDNYSYEGPAWTMPWAGSLLRLLYQYFNAGLFLVAALLFVYLCGRGLRSLALLAFRVVRHFRAS